MLNLAALGFNNQEIGEALVVSVETVKSQMRSVHSSLGARNRTHAVAIAMVRGYIRPDTAAGLAADQVA